MQLMKLITASLLIPVGLFFVLAIATELINPDASPDSKLSATLGGLTLGLPALGVGSWLIWDWYRCSLRSRENRTRRIYSIFFYLLQQNQGRITIPDLVQFTHLSQPEAKKFLDQKAIELDGTLKTAENGDIVYHFRL